MEYPYCVVQKCATSAWAMCVEQVEAMKREEVQTLMCPMEGTSTHRRKRPEPMQMHSASAGSEKTTDIETDW